MELHFVLMEKGRRMRLTKEEKAICKQFGKRKVQLCSSGRYGRK